MSIVSSTETVTSISSVLSNDSTKQLVAPEDAAQLIKIALDEHKQQEYRLDEVQLDEKPNIESGAHSYSSDAWPRRQIIKLFLIGIAITLTTNLPSAFTHTSINTAYTKVNEYLNVSYEGRGQHLEKQDYVWLRSIIGSSWYAGQVIGAQFSPFVTDRWGRKPAYLISTFMMTFACALQSFATLMPYPELLIVGRVLASLFSPMSDAAAILYLQEVSPTHLRGVLSSLFVTTYSIMGLLGMILGTQSVLGHSLTMLLAVPVLPGILSLMMLMYLPETPKFLKIVRHSDKQALKAIHFYQGKRDDNLNTLEAYAYEGDETGGSVLDLFKEKYLQRALICTVLSTIPTLAFYPILQSSTYLLNKLKFEGNVPEYTSAVMMIVLICCCIAAAECLNRFSRRKLLITCATGATISLAIFSVAGALISVQPQAKYLALVGLFGYIIFYGFGLGPISFFLGTELVPLQYRASMFSVSFSLNNVAIVITSLCVQSAYEAFGSLSFLVLFVVPNIFAIMYVNANLPETKNRETHQIVEALRRRTGFFKRRNVKGVANPSFTKASAFTIEEPFKVQLV